MVVVMTDRIDKAMRRLHSSELGNTTIEVYEPAVSYSPGDGFDVTYPDNADETYDARVDSPSDDADTERAGQTSEIEAVVLVRDDTWQQWTGFGEEGDAAPQVVDTADGTRYEVREPLDTHNGLLELGAVEV
jgi:hypothetical protein